MDDQSQVIRELREALLTAQADRGQDSEFRQLAEFFERMKERGYVVKKPYGLPPLDTLGAPVIAHSRVSSVNATRD